MSGQIGCRVVSSIVGIARYLTEIPLVRGSPEVFVAAANGPDMKALGYEADPRILGSGAGLTWEIAAGAALGECLERYCSAIVDISDLVLGSFDELRHSSRDASDPADWALFDPSQNVPHSAFTRQTRIAWREGWDLVSGNPVHVPACMAYLSASPALGASGSAVICPAISTGCACAVHRDEALAGGLCELIERDAFMIVWRNRLPIPEVTIDKESDLFDVYTARFCRPGLEYRIWQTTLDLAVPSFFGIVIDRRRPEPRMTVGGAANLEAERAVLKTLCELTQGLSWLDSDVFKESDAGMNVGDVHTFTDRARFYASRWQPEAFSFLEADRELVPLSSIPSLRVSASEALSALVENISKHGLHPLGVDLTTSDIREAGFIVTRVMVPGLETMDGDHSRQMLGGRRWREVPVRLGRLAEPTSIPNINPYPHPYP